jgi:hypothetical protein
MQHRYDWTIRTPASPKRPPVTRETVTELKRDPSLREVAKIAEKYASDSDSDSDD